MIAPLAATSVLLTACPTPPPSPSTEFMMQLTVPTSMQAPGPSGLYAGLIWYGADGERRTLKAPPSRYGWYAPETGTSIYGSQATLNPGSGLLAELAADPRFATPFATGEAHGMTNVTLSDPNVKTGWLEPVVWQDADGDGELDDGERVVYTTHDRFEYATNDFTYSFDGTGGTSYRESGAIRKGWSRVRHLALAPSATPNATVLRYESVDDRDFFLKEPTNRFTSMSAGRLR